MGRYVQHERGVVTMRCKACNTLLSEWDLKRKDPKGNYLDLCTTCCSVSNEALAVAMEDHGDTKVVYRERNPGLDG